MQIAILVGHRPRSPSGSGIPFPSSFSLSFFPLLSRSDVAAGINTPRFGLLQLLQARTLRFACLRFVLGLIGHWNSIGAILPRRWIVRANRGGL